MSYIAIIIILIGLCIGLYYLRCSIKEGMDESSCNDLNCRLWLGDESTNGLCLNLLPSNYNNSGDAYGKCNNGNVDNVSTDTISWKNRQNPVKPQDIKVEVAKGYSLKKSGYKITEGMAILGDTIDFDRIKECPPGTYKDKVSGKFKEKKLQDKRRQSFDKSIEAQNNSVGLSIAEAKEGLSKYYGIDQENIEIILKG